ncbi:CYN47 [Auxenochlorella protothecoides x Auxenochlorella symbiontica]
MRALVCCAWLWILVVLAPGSTANRLITTLSLDTKDGAERIFLHTDFGAIPIRLLPENAPTVVAAVREMVARPGSCADCAFYRNEARPKKKEGLGPPYGLLQGRMDLSKPYPAVEGSLQVKAGHVAMIPGTQEFFIALSDHAEWETSHAVWGIVEDWFAADFVASHDYKTYKHPEHGTIMRMLVEEFKFTVSSSEFEAPATIEATT